MSYIIFLLLDVGIVIFGLILLIMWLRIYLFIVLMLVVGYLGFSFGMLVV